MNPLLLEETVRRALNEDIGRGDVTTMATVPEDRYAEAKLISRSPGVVAGLEAAALAFKLLDPASELETLVPDGGRLAPKQCFARVKAKARALLSGDRVALNFLQRLSGIATAASEAVEAVKDYPVTIVDTRKTTPGMKMLEKYAVRAGGAKNHRAGLDDAVLIKENHLWLAGGVASAMELVRRRVGPLMKIEVETETLKQVEEAIEAGADIIMLDNMPIETMKQAVSLVAGKALVEASGNINLTNVAEVAASGVDFISLGCIIHSSPPLNMSQLMAD